MSGRPKPREYEKAEINKLIAEKVIESAQIKWEVPIAIVPTKDKNLGFCVSHQQIESHN